MGANKVYNCVLDGKPVVYEEFSGSCGESSYDRTFVRTGHIVKVPYNDRKYLDLQRLYVSEDALKTNNLTLNDITSLLKSEKNQFYFQKGVRLLEADKINHHHYTIDKINDEIEKKQGDMNKKQKDKEYYRGEIDKLNRQESQLRQEITALEQQILMMKTSSKHLKNNS